MKALLFIYIFFIPTASIAQKSAPLPHGMVFGAKPDTTNMLPASKIEAYMGKQVRTSTTIKGKVIKVTKQKGGWFELDAGAGKIIRTHFKNYNINLPLALKGKTVIVEGVAQKQFIADDLQHFAGDTVTGKKQHYINADPKRKLTFEVKGLMVD